MRRLEMLMPLIEPDRALPFLLLLKKAMCLVAVILVPGGLITFALLWWLNRRRVRGNALRPGSEMDQIDPGCGRCG
jgi:hypothetical protein